MIHGFTTKVLFSAGDIEKRITKLAKEIDDRHPDGDLLFVGILKGSFMFLSDLVKKVSRNCEIDFARISSYGGGTVSKGSLDIIMDIRTDVEGKDVILVDDILDSGLTMRGYLDILERKSPRSIETAAFIDKTGRREKFVDLDYYGFRIEHGFVIGYGLDFDEKYRNLDAVYVMTEQ